MGKRGPKRTPTAKLKLLGSRRAAEREPYEPQPEGVPECPDFIKGDAKECWNRVLPQLLAMNCATAIDQNSLARYCQMWARWLKAEAFIEKYGETYPLKNSDGSVKCFQQYPQVSIANRLNLSLCKIEAEFGMTASARAGLAVPPKSDVDDIDDKYFKVTG